ncbi:MAG: site-specific DNA-methyltransferase [Bacteroidales bacterium]|nr:site-specific DNA-methyltransferase [Bacteroidales bacterium]MCF8350628.1 site-specific DNA-methyltransferase [Bacteroidales bacterium]
MDGNSLDIQQIQLEKLKELFPEAISEGKVDWEKLKATLGEDITFSNERYVLNWAGKSDAFKILQSPTTATLTPAKEESVNFEDTGHIFIEGENLEVLKVLQKSYYGKVKMIYIDPPYNTGNDHFIYPDRFSESKEDYLKRVGEKDEEGYLTREGMYRKNSRDSGHYHSNWLNMMYPRLFLARNLLKDDGVIFISIDDNEVHNLRLLLNEVFGEENFFAQIIVRANSRGQTYKQIAKTHEYILVYTKNSETELNELEKDAETSDLNLNDQIGSFNLRELRNRNPKFGKHNRPNLFYPIYVNLDFGDDNNLHPVSLKKTDLFLHEIIPLNSSGKESCWRWGKGKSLENINEDTTISNLVAKKKNDGSIGIYEKYRKTTYKPKSIWENNSFLTETGTLELRQIKMENSFDFPKPVSLIKQCIQLSTNEDDIILDFFSGSATTGHATFNQNKEDEEKRKFICVQLPEKIDEKREAYKSGYKTITDLAKERIRRVINKIQSEQEAEKKEKAGKLDFSDEKEVLKLDLGFKVFKLQSSNFKIWRGNKFENGVQLEKQLDAFTDPTKEGSEEENMLYELLLKSGFDLNSTVHHKGNYYVVNGNEMVVALTKMNETIVKEIISLKPTKCIALDKLFAGNDQLKTNTVLQMRDAGVEFKTI